VEVGVKFWSETDGVVAGIRFYKSAANIGTHVAHLWSVSGTLLASATFTGESASGWQEVKFSTPVPIRANTTYVASYHAPFGHYSGERHYFTRSLDNPPLHALAEAVGSPDGVFDYGPGAFPNSSFEATNYWVDVVFNTIMGPAVPPAVTSVSPPDGALGIPIGAQLGVTFSEVMDRRTVNAATFVLRDASQTPVPSVVTYNTSSSTAALRPTKELAPSTTYTVTLNANSAAIPPADSGAKPPGVSRTWSFTTGKAPGEGAGGPILVVASTLNPFSRYYAEILRAEGLNEFTVQDIQAVSAATLRDYDVVILGELPVSAEQVEMLTEWVNAGGNLIAMRPDKRLAGLLGLSRIPGSLSNGYLLVDTSSPPGLGLTSLTMQFHGAAHLYKLSGASSLATLCRDAVNATSSPAVTLRNVGLHDGHAAAFAFDLARSLVYTRQGNPAWSRQDRDGLPPIRSDDLFYGAAGPHSRPDWVDLNKVEIPQADEQQRLLANLIIYMNLAKRPLPRFWYFPRMLKAVVVMTGDDHGHGGTGGRFERYAAASSPGCSVENWECVRGTAYIYPSTPLNETHAASYAAQGFEIGLHLTLSTDCLDFTAASLDAAFVGQLNAWASVYKQLPPPATERNHCAVWSDYDSQPRIELEHGIRFDTNYYYWPAAWLRDRPGLFTGSGMPMRFAKRDGSLVDVYQAATQMTDESGQSYPLTIDKLLDNAVGPLGYYGAFTANIHNDDPASAASDAIIASAKARGVPVISSLQMLQWLDSRNASSFESLGWSGNVLGFHVSAGPGANGLEVMVPSISTARRVSTLSCDEHPMTYTNQTVKGISYAVFVAATGACKVTYTQ
jgi:hypothetical protein